MNCYECPIFLNCLEGDVEECPYGKESEDDDEDE